MFSSKRANRTSEDVDAPATDVAFSSIASLLGAAGQANYAAVNAALEAIAASSRRRGRDVIAAQWGAWAGAGMAAADPGTRARAARLGVGELEPEDGLRALAAMAYASPTTTSVARFAPHAFAVAPFDWRVAARRLPDSVAARGVLSETIRETIRDDPRFETIRDDTVSDGRAFQTFGIDEGVAGGDDDDANGASFSNLAEAERAVAEEAASLLGGAALDRDAPLMAAGLDSLSAVELRAALASRVKVSLPATLLFDYPTVASAAARVFELAGGSTATLDAATLGDVKPRASPTRSASAFVAATSGDEDESTRGMDAVSATPSDRWDAERLDDARYLPPGVDSARFTRSPSSRPSTSPPRAFA